MEQILGIIPWYTLLLSNYLATTVASHHGTVPPRMCKVEEIEDDSQHTTGIIITLGLSQALCFQVRRLPSSSDNGDGGVQIVLQLVSSMQLLHH